MRFLRCIQACLLLCCLGPPPAATAAETFHLGVAPHSSVRIVIAQYQPLRAALQGALEIPVEVSTARDFTAFMRRALAFDYDIVITTAHQAAVLRDDAGFIPLLTYRADFEAVAVSAFDSGIVNVRELNARPVLGLNPASLVTLWGIDLLEKNQVRAKSLAYITASDSVAELVLRGEAAAGFMSLANYQKLAHEMRARLRIVARSGPLPGRVYLLSPKCAAHEKTVRATLASFAGGDAGQRYFAENQLGGYRPIKRAELDAMRNYADAVRRQLRDDR